MDYQNFRAALFFTASDVSSIKNIDQLENEFSLFEKDIKIGKVYLETYRSDHFIEKNQILWMKEYFMKKGVKVSGAITTTNSANGTWKTLCYTSTEDIEKLKRISEFTASLFDEIILDDFYFTNCKCESCISAKGNRSWTEFRLKLLNDVSRDFVIRPAKKVNPDVKLIIKFPNWYDHYQNNGFNLKDESELFDWIYTGTETRDPSYSQQHLQSYLSYFIMRYLENVKPGRNGGGWFDNFDCYNPVNYIEQANLTLFSKPKEVTLFCYSRMKNTFHMPLASFAFEQADKFLGKLGKPTGVACYKPYHSSGEDHLYDAIGMLGIPLEPFPEFTRENRAILLTASAARDPGIVDKMKNHLMLGNTVVITSGLVEKLQVKGIEDLGIFNTSNRKISVKQFGYKPYNCAFEDYYSSDRDISLPVLGYSTNESWPLIDGRSGSFSAPLVLFNNYGNGKIYVWVIPDNYEDLYHLPAEILKPIRELLLPDFPVQIEGKAGLGLFVYDNKTFILESFLHYNTVVNLRIRSKEARILNLIDEKVEKAGYQTGENTIFCINLSPGSYKPYKII